jgi:hypothetical protein
MHEKVHQRTGEKENVRQISQDVGTMLGQEEEPGDENEPDQHDIGAGDTAVVLAMMIMIHEDALLFLLYESPSTVPEAGPLRSWDDSDLSCSPIRMLSRWKPSPAGIRVAR